MEIDVSKMVLVSRKSLVIWKAINKQCVRMNANLDIVNRSIKAVQSTVKRSADGMNRSMDRLNQSLQVINDTLLDGFKRMPPKLSVSRDLVMEQSQQASQSQQLAVSALSTSPSDKNVPPEEEKAKKVNWWKGLKEKKKPEPKNKEVTVEASPKPKINLVKGPPPPSPPPVPADSKIMKFLKTANVVNPFNRVKSFGEKAVKSAAKPSDIVDWNTLNDNVDTALGQIGAKALGALRPVMDTLNKALTSGQLMPIIDAMANGFLFIANVISMVVNGLLWLVGVVQDNWSYIKPILEAIAIVYLAAMIVQVYMLAAAWLAANWPILIVIGVIALLVLILQQLGVSASDVVGAIAGSFGVLVAIVQNIGIWMRNIFYLVGDAIVNIFNTAVNKVKEFLYGLATGALDVLYNMALGAENFAGGFMKVMATAINWVLTQFNSMIDSLSKIPFFEKLGIGKIKIDMLDPEVPHAASDLIDKYRQGIKTLEPKPDDKPKRNTEMWDYVNVGDSFKSYQQGGVDFTKNFSNMGRSATEKAKDLTNPMNGNGNPSNPTSILANQNGNLNTVNRVNQVGAINDTVDISSDDLKMLRELAEIQAIQNFVELTPTVQVTTGNINNAGDIDSIITKIGQKLNEEFVSTAQGVYT
ncbi:hypothetical protein [Paenibacillus sp. HW567]|uniref:hypothetical protein n=1 Tax=Paenibacillus sp. HW567 TaxID=1034769 RepID=UPI0003733F63|nr:hypothetical protein [Paenibacillus sp. HW567]